MIRSDFRIPIQTELKSGLAIWLDGRHFEDTNQISSGRPNNGANPVCGPFLVDRVLFQSRPEPRVDIIDPGTGRQRSMKCSWLLVPKEEQ